MCSDGLEIIKSFLRDGIFLSLDESGKIHAPNGLTVEQKKILFERKDIIRATLWHSIANELLTKALQEINRFYFDIEPDPDLIKEAMDKYDAMNLAKLQEALDKLIKRYIEKVDERIEELRQETKGWPNDKGRELLSKMYIFMGRGFTKRKAIQMAYSEVKKNG